MAPFFPGIELFNDFVMDIGILALVILVYNFIPDRAFSRSRHLYALYVGIIFTLASVIGLLVLWRAAPGMAMVVNSVIVPLAGFIGGPVSAVITVAAILPLQFFLSGGTQIPSGLPFIIISASIGIAFFYIKGWQPFVKWALTWQLLIMSLLLGSILTITMEAAFEPAAGRDDSFQVAVLLIILIIGGILILGNIIGFIDRKKKTERELLLYRDDLEKQVRERTAELERINSLIRATLESTADGIIVTDREGIIRVFNKRAADLLGYPKSDLASREKTKKFSDFVIGNLLSPDQTFQMICAVPSDSEKVTATCVAFRNGRIYEIYALPEILGGRIVGRVWNLRDVTDQKNAEDALKNANSKLLLLSSITRHDILNQLTALTAYHHLIEEKSPGPEITEYLAKMRKILDVIQFQIEFTSDYQDMGIKQPVWHNAAAAFMSAAGSFEAKGIRFHPDIGMSAEIFADPLLERVFYNLIDNSIRHGERVSEIRLTAQRSGDDLLLIYEDNGNGVPDAQKESIFEKGFGKHTGLGMFLIREVLGITGITIRENGVFGSGARFEIRIPAGKFREPGT